MKDRRPSHTTQRIQKMHERGVSEVSIAKAIGRPTADGLRRVRKVTRKGERGGGRRPIHPSQLPPCQHEACLIAREDRRLLVGCLL